MNLTDIYKYAETAEAAYAIFATGVLADQFYKDALANEGKGLSTTQAAALSHRCQF